MENTTQQDIDSAVRVAERLAQRNCAAMLGLFTNVESADYESLARDMAEQYKRVRAIEIAFDNLSMSVY